MLKFTALILFMLMAAASQAQNIVTALYLNENKDYKTAQPKKIEQITTTYPEDNKRTERVVKTFDSAGMLLNEERYNRNDDLMARLTYTNDDVKKLVLRRFYEEVGQYTSAKETNTYTYDTDNALVNVLSQDENDKITQRCDMVNDKKGHPVELTLYNQFGIAITKETAFYLYDRNTVVITKLAVDGASTAADTTKISLKNAHLFPEKDENYNAKGDLVKWSGKNADGVKVNFEEEYKYDKTGNCVSDILYTITTSGSDKEKKLEREIRKKYTY